jgi:phage baseplate assembly protein W
VAVVIHFLVPFEVVNAAAGTVKHDSDDEIRQNVAVLLGTRLGERPTEPEFGISDPVFRLGVDQGEIESAVAQFEPRARVAVVVTPSDDESDILVKVSRR